MTNEELFKGMRIVSGALEAQPNSLAQVIGIGLGIAVDALDIAAKAPNIDPAVLLRTFREGLRAGLADELQKALDASSADG